MSYFIKNCEIYTGETAVKNGYIIFDKTIIQLGAMEDFPVKYQGEEIKVLPNAKIIPGFIDIHSHGGYGIDVMDGSAADIVAMTERMTKEGVTTYFPTTMTQSDEKISIALKTIKKAKDLAGEASLIEGIHLEGPFISPVFKGAQPEKYVADPDVDKMAKWLDDSGGLIKIVTYAPEQPNAVEFEAFCLEHGIVLSTGHSNATRKDLKKSKTSHITHLYNAQRGLHHREAGVTGHGLLESNVNCEVIVDGFHIVPDMVKLAYELKGNTGLVLITDSMRGKGMPEGKSELGGQTVYIKDKQARLEEGNLAGSVLTFIEAFQNIIAFTGCNISDAVKMSSVNQAKEFKLSNKGLLAPEFDADIVVLNDDLEISLTIAKGRVIYDGEN